jgi:hypothetical protein
MHDYYYFKENNFLCVQMNRDGSVTSSSTCAIGGIVSLHQNHSIIIAYERRAIVDMSCKNNNSRRADRRSARMAGIPLHRDSCPCIQSLLLFTSGLLGMMIESFLFARRNLQHAMHPFSHDWPMSPARPGWYSMRIFRGRAAYWGPILQQPRIGRTYAGISWSRHEVLIDQYLKRIKKNERWRLYYDWIQVEKIKK